MKKFLTAFCVSLLFVCPAMAGKKLTFKDANVYVLQALFVEYCGDNNYKQALTAFNNKYDKSSGIDNDDLVSIVAQECGLCNKSRCDEDKFSSFLLDIISLTNRVYNANYQFYPSEMMLMCAQGYRQIVEPSADIRYGKTIKDTVINTFDDEVLRLVRYMINKSRDDALNGQYNLAICLSCFTSGFKKQAQDCMSVLDKDILDKDYTNNFKNLELVRDYYAKYADCVFKGQELQCKNYYVNNKFSELPKQYTWSCHRRAQSVAREAWPKVQNNNQYSLAEHRDARDAFDKFWILNMCSDYDL